MGGWLMFEWKAKVSEKNNSGAGFRVKGKLILRLSKYGFRGWSCCPEYSGSKHRSMKKVRRKLIPSKWCSQNSNCKFSPNKEEHY